MSGPLRLSLDPHSRFTDQQLAGVMDRLGLAECNLQDQVGEGGTRLTPTQRQLVRLTIQYCSDYVTLYASVYSIGRCVLAQPRVLVLDEATSSLDCRLEGRVLAALMELLHQSTIITVAHRLANINMFDRVIVLGEGRLLEVRFD